MASSSVVPKRRKGGWIYDVFLSFRGRDTRHSFVDHLYAELVRRGISVFKDDEMLGGGQSILEEHVKAIKESRFAVVVFSENYATSSLCLEELSTIMECRTQMKVLPVFYHVHPSDVRKQKGDFATAFQTHEHEFKGEMDKVNKWRAALTAAASLSDLHILPDNGGTEAALISEIVEEILADIQPASDATSEDRLVGIEPRIDALISLLKMEATEEVRIVGIWGAAGIGKTTIAAALFRRIAHTFEGSSFVANVRENSSGEKDICALQKKILQDILGERRYKPAPLRFFLLFMTRDEGAQIIQKRCRRKKVLLVLDDVNDVEQLKFLAATPAKWFGPGSRIIITTRYQHLLSSYADEKYKPATLSGDQAVELFSRHAFLENSPPKGYEELSARAIRSTGGLPLALKVLGSFLHGRQSNVWESTLDRLVEIPNKEIYDTPELSFNVVQTKKGGWTYDVFLSFSARDTGNNFSDHLYAALVKEIRVFRHGYAGQTISEDVVKAIKESRFAVVVISKNYANANSSWCLEELSEIMECHDQMGQKVLPVFYHVNPSDIRKQKGGFAPPFKKHEDKFRGEVNKVKKWKVALTAATNLPGLLRIPKDNMGESTFVKEIVEQTLADVEISDRRIGKLLVSDKEIGKGSNGTIVLEGIHDTRPVAVKRVVKSHHDDIAFKEIDNLLASDHHVNIVRYYGVEDDKDFVYIALERCICSLHDLIVSPTTVDQSKLTLLEVESFKVREPIEYPSPELLKAMRDTVTGLAHLHELGIIHRDLKPQNVLICKYSSMISAKVSDMGISKCLPADKSSLTSATGYGSSGWQAPETLRKESQITRAVDLFSLGCLLFFCITGGEHPFGDDVHERDTNIKNDRKDLSLVVDNPEAFDLVSNLLHPDPKFRPSAAEVYHHPLFWDPKMRLLFFQEVSDRAEGKTSSSDLLQALDGIGTVVFGSNWNDKLDSTLLDNIEKGKHRKYKYDNVRELIRLIRNKFNHHSTLPGNVKVALGDVPTGFERYFSSRLPKLLIEVYKVLKQFCEREEWLKPYYKKMVV